MTTDGKSRMSGPDRSLEPGLYVVATPIGHLRDITLRAIDTLRAADVIACEDTRVSRKLLAAYDIHTPLTAYHDHNADRAGPDLLARLARKERVALISDAGTPLISDPGYRLVCKAGEAGHPVLSVPGPSAVTAALSVSGLATDRFLFLGFLPPKAGARRQLLAAVAQTPATLVIYEATNRLAATLSALESALGDRPAAICRELTKRFEEIRRGRLSELGAALDGAPPKGEAVILIAPPGPALRPSDAIIDAELDDRLAAMGTKDAAREVAKKFGLSATMLYQRALKRKDET